MQLQTNWEVKGSGRTAVSALPERPREGDDGETDERSCEQMEHGVNCESAPTMPQAILQETAHLLATGTASLAVGMQHSPSMRANVIQ